MASQLHVSEGTVGWVAEVFPLIYVLLAVPCGIWIDKWFRGSLAVGAALTTLGALMRLATPTFALLLTAQIVVSIGQPLVLNSINKIAAAYVREEKRTIAIAIGSSSLFFGILLAMFTGPFLIAPYSMSLLMWVQAAITTVSAGVLILLLRQKPLYIVDMVAQVPLRKVWNDSYIRRLSVLLFIGFGLFIAITTWLQALLASSGVTDVEVGIALALMTAAGMVGAAVLPDWTIRTNRARGVTMAALIAMGIALLAILNGHPFWLITVLLVATGFLILAVLPIILSITDRHFPEEEVGTATGLLMLAGNGGGIVLAMLVQAFIASPAISIVVLLISTLLALPVALRFPKTEARHHATHTDSRAL